MTRKIGIGIAGLGTVGSGVVRLLESQAEILRNRTGFDFEVRRVAVRDISKARPIELAQGILTDSVDDLLSDPEIEIILELMGGLELAKEFTCKALESGRIVVTANKALLAEHGAEVFAQAEESGKPVFYEAAVAGGIPIIKSMKEAFVCNKFPRITGILNGTSNYILTRMEDAGLTYEQALEEASQLGYAEADPTLDVNGWDAGHKAIILAALAYGFWVQPKEVTVNGIQSLTAEDVGYADQLGYRIKLLANIHSTHPEGISLRVVPTLIPKTHVLASVSGVYNAVSVLGDVVGETLFYGRGAGEEPTTSSVLGDLIEAAHALTRPPSGYGFTGHELYGKCLPPSKDSSRFYLRLGVDDRPGVLADIAGILGQSGIGIASVIQPGKPNDSGTATLVLMVHEASCGAMAGAVAAINSLDSVQHNAQCLHVEDFE